MELDDNQRSRKELKNGISQEITLAPLHIHDDCGSEARSERSGEGFDGAVPLDRDLPLDLIELRHGSQKFPASNLGLKGNHLNPWKRPGKAHCIITLGGTDIDHTFRTGREDLLHDGVQFPLIRPQKFWWQDTPDATRYILHPREGPLEDTTTRGCPRKSFNNEGMPTHTLTL